MAEPLKIELATFEKNRDRLVGEALGKFVLIKGEEIHGIFNDEADAIRAGYESFGNVPFLVKMILKVDIPQNFTSNLILA
jgi:hypothetical protein